MPNDDIQIPTQDMLERSANSALKAATNILTTWSCSLTDMAVILDLAENKLVRFKRESSLIKLNQQQQIRVSYVLNIYQSIRLLFNNPDNVDNFMRLKNNNEPFYGKSPLDLLLTGSIENLAMVHKHLENLVSNRWQPSN